MLWVYIVHILLNDWNRQGLVSILILKKLSQMDFFLNLVSQKKKQKNKAFHSSILCSSTRAGQCKTRSVLASQFQELQLLTN